MRDCQVVLIPRKFDSVERWNRRTSLFDRRQKDVCAVCAAELRLVVFLDDDQQGSEQRVDTDERVRQGAVGLVSDRAAACVVTVPGADIAVRDDADRVFLQRIQNLAELDERLGEVRRFHARKRQDRRRRGVGHQVQRVEGCTLLRRIVGADEVERVELPGDRCQNHPPRVSWNSVLHICLLMPAPLRRRCPRRRTTRPPPIRDRGSNRGSRFPCRR